LLFKKGDRERESCCLLVVYINIYIVALNIFIAYKLESREGEFLRDTGGGESGGFDREMINYASCVCMRFNSVSLMTCFQ